MQVDPSFKFENRKEVDEFAMWIPSTWPLVLLVVFLVSLLFLSFQVSLSYIYIT